jgi:hypothetical protein
VEPNFIFESLGFILTMGGATGWPRWAVAHIDSISPVCGVGCGPPWDSVKKISTLTHIDSIGLVAASTRERRAHTTNGTVAAAPLLTSHCSLPHAPLHPSNCLWMPPPSLFGLLGNKGTRRPPRFCHPGNRRPEIREGEGAVPHLVWFSRGVLEKIKELLKATSCHPSWYVVCCTRACTLNLCKHCSFI